MELSLDVSFVFLPKTMSEFLREVSKIRDLSLKLSKIDSYVDRLEEERRKIDGFKRELPLCMVILNDVIGKLKEEAMIYRESVPLRRKFDEERGAKLENDKKNWMSSARLWISNTQFKSTNEEDDESVTEDPIKDSSLPNNGGTFLPFNGQSDHHQRKLNACLSSNTNCRVDQSRFKFQTNPWSRQERKERRRWSPELHRRFVDALQKLGGSQVATPKQIREMMQVEGLTNDEVKSHLQKYRIHIRKVSVSSMDQNPQSLFLGARESSSSEAHSSEEDEKSDGKSWKSVFQRQEEVHSCVA